MHIFLNQLLVIWVFFSFLTTSAEAGLIISVREDLTETIFSWSGIIGASGTSPGSFSNVSGDFIRPGTGEFHVADRDRGDVDDGGAGRFDGIRYDGSTFAYGTGADFTNFLVDGNTPFIVASSFGGALVTGSVTDGGTDYPDLATHVFTGSFTLPGTLAAYGLFDTVATDISAGPVTLWTADTGTGSIMFQQAASVPEPSSLVIMTIAVLGLATRRWSLRGTKARS